MTAIQTVRGPVDLNQLGQTMMHKHVFFGNWSEDRWREPSITLARLGLHVQPVSTRRRPSALVFQCWPCPAPSPDGQKERFKDTTDIMDKTETTCFGDDQGQLVHV